MNVVYHVYVCIHILGTMQLLKVFVWCSNRVHMIVVSFC